MKDEVTAKLVAAGGGSVRAKAIYVIACLVDLLWGILCLIGWPQSTRRAPSLIFFSLGIRAPARPAVTPYLLCSGDRRRGFRLARRDHNIGTQSFIPRR